MKKLSLYILQLTKHPETRGGINKKTISIRILSKNLVRLRQWCGKIGFKYLMMN